MKGYESLITAQNRALGRKGASQEPLTMSCAMAVEYHVTESQECLLQ